MMQSRTRRPLPRGLFYFQGPSVEEELGEAVAMSGVRTVAGLRTRLRLRALLRTARGGLRPRRREAARQPRVDREGPQHQLALSRAVAGPHRATDRPGDALHAAGQGAQPREGARPRPPVS